MVEEFPSAPFSPSPSSAIFPTLRLHQSKFIFASSFLLLLPSGSSPENRLFCLQPWPGCSPLSFIKGQQFDGI
ncbi:hypothetical protein SDJN02_24642, partial [Cucurbita argyrosperma subsp. argyrosperma]